jgi:hypothetical protein
VLRKHMDGRCRGVELSGKPNSNGDVARGMPGLMEGVVKLSSPLRWATAAAQVEQRDKRVVRRVEPNSPRAVSGVQPKARVDEAASLLTAESPGGNPHGPLTRKVSEGRRGMV